jgi:hypothetical protein
VFCVGQTYCGEGDRGGGEWGRGNTPDRI